MRLEFDPVEHKYTMDGRRLPSVTGIMRIAGLTGSYGFDDPIHAMRGHAVHAGCSIIDMGGEPPSINLTGDYASNPDYVQVAKDIEEGYWPAYRAFKARTGFQGRIYECAMVHPTLGYAGTFDVCGERGDEIWLPDLKSGVLPDLVPIQLSGYSLLIREGIPVDPQHPGLDWLREMVKSGKKILRKAVRLQKDGTDTLFSETKRKESYDSRVFDAGWMSAISLYNLRSSYGLL